MERVLHETATAAEGERDEEEVCFLLLARYAAGPSVGREGGRESSSFLFPQLRGGPGSKKRRREKVVVPGVLTKRGGGYGSYING